jgi:hypothetical protein
MDNVLQEIDRIFLESNNNINDKNIGINYLESIKYLLIDNLKKSKLFSEIETKNFNNIDLLKKFSENNLHITIKNNINSDNYIKYNLDNHYLCIVLTGLISFKVHLNNTSNKSHTLNIYPNGGIVLSGGTIISNSISKDSLFLEIFNMNNLIGIEK